MKMKFSKEATIGVVSIISLVLLYIGVNYLKGINLFRPANHYYVACSCAESCGKKAKCPDFAAQPGRATIACPPAIDSQNRSCAM